MKLIVSQFTDTLILEVETTQEEELKEFEVSRNDLHYWYPFNINFFYKYTNSKGFLYLVKEKSYEGSNYYNVDILKRTKPLETKNGVMFNPEVYKRNKTIIALARQMGIPTIDSSYTMEDIEEGFDLLSKAIAMLKRDIELRYLIITGKESLEQPLMSEEWDELIYSYAVPLENEYLIKFGEIYCMLNLMRKLKEER